MLLPSTLELEFPNAYLVRVCSIWESHSPVTFTAGAHLNALPCSPVRRAMNVYSRHAKDKNIPDKKKNTSSLKVSGKGDWGWCPLENPGACVGLCWKCLTCCFAVHGLFFCEQKVDWCEVACYSLSSLALRNVVVPVLDTWACTQLAAPVCRE